VLIAQVAGLLKSPMQRWPRWWQPWRNSVVVVLQKQPPKRPLQPDDLNRIPIPESNILRYPKWHSIKTHS
jgi:hypothetical protein